MGTRGGRKIPRGAMYATVTRLERKGFLTQSVRAPQDGGRAKQHFDVTADGLATLRTAQQSLQKMRTGLESLLAGAS